MVKLILLAVILWVLLFAFRVTQIGGIDPTYQDSGTEILQPLRSYLSDISAQIMPFPQSALLSGIILGDKKSLPFFFKKDLQATSTTHIVVVSGQNLTIVAGFIMNLVSFIGRRKTIALTLLAITFYSVLTGFQVPVVRAAIMTFFALLAQILGKERQGMWILILTAGLMLLYNPNWLFNISFQLSFLATFGVVVVAPIFLDCLKRVPGILKQDLAVTLAAQIMVLPILAYDFGQISAVGLLANLLVLWSIPAVMIAGFVSLVLGMVNIFLGQLMGLLPSVLLTYFIYIVEFLAKVPGASLQVGESPIILWAGYYLLLGALLWMVAVKNLNSSVKPVV